MKKNDIFKPLLPLREEITAIDEAILQLLFKRRELAKKVIAIKIEQNLPLRDLEREKKIIEKLMLKSIDLKMNPNLIRSLYEQIIADSVALQEQIKQG